ncbi:transglycosylase domain-containing protein [Fusibacter tunisiensis]|uniref:Penicillin-binding protein 1A n=1 Tax=Fusibacter tunisiensis TaxID=1008308 RepID=A0ABS2MQI7_9FIRM|nr:transglycosylase domain-containing protein [Fusibacter tunisiensis]MBM7561666.1 penicillin-binding protein 1A [Fusibacter tunisiensis]
MDRKKPITTQKKPVSSTKKTKKKKRNKSKKGLVNTFKILLIFFIIAGLLSVGGVYFYISAVLEDIPPINPATIDQRLTENSIIVDSKGQVLEQIHMDGLRTVISFDEMSPDLINAFVALEDKTFWTHNGFNIIRLFGAVKDTLTTGKRLGGTSTITQQLARNIYLYEIRDERDISRKIKEAYYAIELEKHLDKEQIIEAYLNFIALGANTNGVEAASQTYFSKSASELNYIEGALLAGIAKGPGIYSPMITKAKEDVEADDYILDDSDPYWTRVYNPRTEDRYYTAIYLMRENDYITNEEYEHANTIDLKTVLKPNFSLDSEISSFFADMVKDEVRADLMELYGYSKDEALNLLMTGGLVIESTIDFDMQKTLESHYALEDFTEYYGESTASAVKAFQRDNDLKVDGVSGQNTLAKINELSQMDMSVFTQRSYAKGANSEEVVHLKKALFELGYLITNENFPKITATLDSKGNIVSEETNKIRVYKQSNMIDEDGNLVLPESDYRFDDAGNLVLVKDRMLSFYPKYENDALSRIQVVLKETYTHTESDEADLRSGKHNLSDLYIYSGHDLLIDDAYKSFDENGNVVVNKSFLTEKTDFYQKNTEGDLVIPPNYFVMASRGVIQPQSAMVILDYRTGELKAIAGGRDILGQKMYNRALNPRQPGSAIKPLAVYTPAIDSGRFTAASVFDDRPSYLSGDPELRWPVNWYENYSSYNKYWGLVNLRESMQWSINVTAAKLSIALGTDVSADYLERFGVTSLVKDGPVNDMNTAAMALGGMTRGISALELTSAYGAIANQGVRNDVITYKNVRNRNGEIILENRSNKTIVVDENVAYIVQDMMKTGIEQGGGSTSARLSPGNDIIPVSGKTGTTSSNIDAWFVGYTPYYVGGIWFGNDLNIPLDQGSRVAAKFWQVVMSEIHADFEPKAFEEPSGIERAQVDRISGKLPTELSYLDPRNTVYTEIFLRGTVPTEEDDVHVMADVCTESGLLAGEFCPTTSVESKLFVKRPEPYIPADHNNIAIKDMEYDLPIETCDLHTAENYVPEPSDPEYYIGIKPTVMLANGSLYVQRPYPILLTNGQEIILPPGSKILENNDILLPDGSIIPSYNIKEIPNYSTEELDILNPIIEPEPTTETTTEPDSDPDPLP